MAKAIPAPQPPPKPVEEVEVFEIVAGHSVRHGSNTAFFKSEEAVRTEIAIAVFTELVGQAARANRLHDMLMATLAKQAVNAADTLLKELDASA